MSDAPGNPAARAGGRCSRCAGDLSALVSLASFCPRCGAKLPAGWDAVPVAEPRALEALPDVVRGYANAMFRLGFRYEVRHNDHEAVRCYGKASRLGNEPAGARLAEIPLARTAAAGSADPEAPDATAPLDLPGTRIA